MRGRTSDAGVRAAPSHGAPVHRLFVSGWVRIWHARPAVNAPARQTVARNRKASFEYSIEEELEAGLVLTGTEVKSLRDGKCQLVDAYGQIQGGEAWAYEIYIAPYVNGTHGNHEARRTRKMLLKRTEIDKIERKIREKGLTLIPLEIYFKGSRAKLKLGLCRGKKAHDKRHSIKARDEARDLRRERG
jgi:SsrA-binding protein